MPQTAPRKWQGWDVNRGHVLLTLQGCPDSLRKTKMGKQAGQGRGDPLKRNRWRNLDPPQTEGHRRVLLPRCHCPCSLLPQITSFFFYFLCFLLPSLPSFLLSSFPPLWQNMYDVQFATFPPFLRVQVIGIECIQDLNISIIHFQNFFVTPNSKLVPIR